MNDIKEISRRCEVGEDGGVACGPISTTAVCAEMEIELSGERLFLNCTWVDAASDSISFEVTKESLFDFLVMKNDDMDEMERIRDAGLECWTSYNDEYDGEFPEQFKTLVQIVKDKLVEEAFVNPDDFEDGEIDWDF